MSNLIERDVLVELHIVVFRDEGYRVSGVRTNGTKLLPNTIENRIKATFALLAAVQDWAKGAGVTLELPIQDAMDQALRQHLTERNGRSTFYG